MTPVWSVADTRAAEAKSGVPEATLIDRASTAVARRAAAMLDGVYGARVLVVAGPGHNGADALWAGAKLAARGADVAAFLPLGEPRDAHGTTPLERLRRSVSTAGYDLVIDGVLGVGGRTFDTRPDWEWHGRTLAVDVPSGIDADTGAKGTWAVRAEVTVTFGETKRGLVVGAGMTHAGLVEVAPIGLAERRGFWTGYGPMGGTHLLDARDVGWFVAAPEDETDKYRRGVVGIVAGSAAYPGAAVLACRGAQRAGCGYVRLLAPPAVADAVRARHPEVVAADRDGDLPRVDVWVVGPGLGDDLDAVERVLAADVPVVVDADALRALPPHVERRAATVVTPHTGEFERLTGIARADAEADRIGAARRAAYDLGVAVLLKGRSTVVAAPGGATYVVANGTPWLATAGTGDVLAGAVGAFLTRERRDAARAAACAAWLHGLAGRLAAGTPGAAVTATDVAESLRDAARIALAAC